MITLCLDTTDNKITDIRIIKDNKEYKKIIHHLRPSADNLLKSIKSFLKEKNISLQEITNIKVNQGPGSYTGIRVGLTVANTLAFALKISVNNKKIGEYERPVYN